jgi:hypothetical protein
MVLFRSQLQVYPPADDSLVTIVANSWDSARQP